MKSITRRIFFKALFLSVLLNSRTIPTAWAQNESPDGPMYVVQSGDSLWDIALRFRVSVQDLAAANGITNPDQLTVGAELVIPGLQNVQGRLITATLPFGESLRSFSRRYQIPAEVLARLNRLASPAELYAGFSLILPIQEETPPTVSRSIVSPGDSLLELAVLSGSNPWAVVRANNLGATWETLPGDVLILTSRGQVSSPEDGPAALPNPIGSVGIDPLPLLQGKAGVIRIATSESLSLSGSFMDHELHFFPDGGGNYIALQGVHALAEQGAYPLHISATLNDGTPFEFSQSVLVQELDYPYDRPLTVDPATIDPAVTRPEDAQWTALTGPATPIRLWNGVFRLPSPLPVDYCLETNECWSSRFGNRRSYNGSAYTYFHTGLDIFGGSGTEIYAPAPGVVVFAGPLTVRGNATMIDHGWGVYTGYMHQSEIYVEVGDRVEPGQVIGLVGGTGRAEGAHLHWEVWVGGIQVDPLDWLATAYP